MSVDRAPATTRIAAGTAGTLSLTVYEGSEPADPGDVTVTVTRADGTAIVSDAPATADGNTRTLPLTPVQTAAVDLLTVTWKASTPAGAVYTTEAEIIGEHLFALSEARAFERGQLSNTTTYPDSVLEAGRARIHDQFEDIVGICVCPRYRRVVLGSPGSNVLFLPDLLVQSVRSVETRSGISWTAFSSSDLDDVLVDPSGVLMRDSGASFPAGRRNVRVSYVCGLDRIPLDIRRAGLRVLVEQVQPSSLSDRATTMTTELGTFSMPQAGVQQNAWSVTRHFGLPEVDAVLARYADRYNVPRIA